MLATQRISIKLKRLGISYTQLFVVSVVLALLYSFLGTTSKIYEPQLINAIDKYSANILSYHTTDTPVDFSWIQFLDLNHFFASHKKLISPLNCEEFANRIQKGPRSFFNCRDQPDNKLVPISLQQNVNMYIDDMSRKIFGKIHLYKSFPNPSNLLYLFHDNYVKFPVKTETKFMSLKSVNLKSAASKLTSFNQDLSPKPVISLNYDDFNYKKNLETFSEESKVKELHYKYKDTKRARKYFGEAYLIDYTGAFNLDWRFFNATNVLEKDLDLKNAKISRLIRGWLNLCSKLEIPSWLTDNNLIGWHMNGLHLPFEDDFSFQITMKDILKLVDQGLNQSIIFDYSDIDKGIKSEMFLDISPYFKMRDRNNKENLVDIRLIDLETGLFLNIIGVSTFQYERLYNYQQKPVFQSLEEGDSRRIENYIKRFKDSREGLLNTKNLEVYNFDDFSSMIPVMFENQVAYLPANYMTLLTNKYFDPFAHSKKGYIYRAGINLWIPKDTCKLPPFLSIPTIEQDMQCLKIDKVNRLHKEYKKATEFHESFMESFNELSDYSGFTLKPLDFGGFK
ncbi:hypothetical protein PSN45_004440 [Yamadazyma tenuis]|uniref:LicD/FKTN/FKRP nucleotidyltransferase domain-containing protein n=1 Tax=Candida tenuis (strain ATCC 10573 / BCRC 21748 / CBS 615 / JCM 9827 / NBRC 10315 / NRRL Y-1498 / VKM Y-70) TaxID=590646 RepID=G3B5R4_CANTC|nr:uncharacterized protein CANTEDRAFT_135115 [Yamadazyma tenuis ATCC 10573]EGV63288.1 hypothetical protein CANTEDRAFT_135115 [Yamadazyma tenuis ATCC 10573]WEJ96895.1 hypothetical protein PSN45_004440 [Yamadazyma tenuis]